MLARIALVVTATLGLCVAAAADPWKDESGNGWWSGLHAPWSYDAPVPGKYEWEAGGCKYEYKVDGGGFKEEYKCDRGPYLALLPPTPFLPGGYTAGGSGAPQFVLGPQVAAQGGRYCREYQKQVWIGGELESAYGIACRQPDGSWELMN